MKFKSGIQTPFLLPSGGLGSASSPRWWRGGGLTAMEWSSPGRCEVSPPQLSALAPKRPTLFSFPLVRFKVPHFQTFFFICSSFLPLVQSVAQKFNLATVLEQMENTGPTPQIPGTSAQCRISSHLLLRSAKAKPKNNFQIEELEFSLGHQQSTSHHMSVFPQWKVQSLQIPCELISSENKRIILGKAVISLPATRFIEVSVW